MWRTLEGPYVGNTERKANSAVGRDELENWFPCYVVKPASKKLAGRYPLMAKMLNHDALLVSMRGAL